jgi:2-C-methyl-D-erythritol 2,4-cyclodiphosphate synthase
VRDGLAAAGWRVVNTDLTLVCEQPRIGPHVAAMRQVIADVLGLDTAAVSVKATTTEQLGFCGRGEGIAVLAVALITDEE